MAGATTASWTLGALSLTSYPYSVPFGTEHGQPDSEAVVLTSFLADGNVEIAGHVGNRTVTLPILIEGASLSDLAKAEAALAAEVTKPQNMLLVDPSGGAPAYTLLVSEGSLTWNRGDNDERNGIRQYTVTLSAQPYVYSVAETYTAPFTPPATVNTTVVDDASSTTGWTAFDDGNATETLTVSGGAIVASSSVTSGVIFSCGPKRTGTVSLAGQPYVAIDQVATLADGWDFVKIAVVIDGTEQPIVAYSTLPNGYTRLWVQPGTASFSTIAVYATIKPNRTYPTTGQVAQVKVDQVLKSNSYTTFANTKQLQRVLTIGGSAPTTGSIEIAHSTNALGDVLLYTSSQGDTPALRGYRSTALGGAAMGSPTGDSTTVSGFYDTLNGTTTDLWYDLPISAIPDGEYLLMGRIKASNSPALSIHAGVYMNGTLVSDWGFAKFVSLPTISAWTFTRFGMAHFPNLEAGTNARFVVSLQCGGGTILVDEFYLFNLTTGDLTQVACGAGTPASNGPSNRLWVDSPAIGNDGLGGLMRGTAADRSDAVSGYSGAASPGVHRFAPGMVNAFTACTEAPSASIGFRHHQAWLHNAAQ